MSKDVPERAERSSGPAVPESVSVAVAELAEDLREGLLALAVGAGLQVMTALMEQDVAAVCGPRGKHDPQRSATRHGHGGGSVTLGGRRVPITRPRTRATDGSGELPVPAYTRHRSLARGSALRRSWSAASVTTAAVREQDDPPLLVGLMSSGERGVHEAAGAV